MRSAASPSPICVISSHKLVAKFLFNVLRSEYSCDRFVSEYRLHESGDGVNPLFIIDCVQLPFPLSEYVCRLAARHPGSYFIVIDREPNENEIQYMLSFGVHGVLAHIVVEDWLVQAAESVMAGGVWIPQRALRAQASLSDARRNGARAGEPTHREMEVLELLRRRFSNREIGEALRIRESTVKYHVSNLLGKLDVSSRLELGRIRNSMDPFTQML